MLLSLAVLSLLSLALSQPTPTPPPPSPPTCACDGECKVEENIRVKSLCADSLCVGGDPIVPGDGDPCTNSDIVDGVVEHAHIPGCCKVDSDCADTEKTCVISSCFKEAGKNYGECRHEPIKAPHCCGCDADCPDKPCKVKTCEDKDPAEGFFVKRPGKSGLTLIKAADAVINFPGQCVYDDVPASENCCLDSNDCTCPPGATPICDVGHKCTCTTQFQCRNDLACRNDTVEVNKCKAKGQCFNRVCDRGFCNCKQDFDADADGDGVSCKEDCDDNNASVKGFVFCPNGTLAEIDPDNDRIYECGTVVNKTCGTTCSNGAVPLNKTWVAHSQDPKGPYYLAYHCDCCSDAPGIDELIYCGRDQNGNGVFELQDADTSTPCAEPNCVPAVTPNDPPAQGGSGHSEPTQAQRDAQCARAHNNDTDWVFVPPTPESARGDTPEDCDLCDETDVDGTDEVAPSTCVKRIEVGSDTDAVCDPLTLEDADPVASCCADIATRGSAAPGYDVFIACCNANDTAGEDPCVPGDAGFPFVYGVCGCDDDFTGGNCLGNDTFHDTLPTFNDALVYDGTAINVECVFDRDNDEYYNCHDVVPACIRLPSEGTGEGDGETDTSIYLNLQDDVPADETKLCQLIFYDQRDQVVSLLEATNDQDISSGNEDGTFCDCSDEDENVHNKIVCLTDQDGDGVPFCPNLFADPSNRFAQCTQVCASECDDGFISTTATQQDGTTPLCAIPGSGDRKAKAAAAKKDAASLKALKAAAAKHSWFKKRQVPDGTDPRQDESCDNDYECTVCDCCDIDCAVYEGSTARQFLGLTTFGSPSKNKCGNWDYDCEAIQCIQETPFGACPRAPTATDCEATGSRILFEVLKWDDATSQDVQSENVYNAFRDAATCPDDADPDPVGGCECNEDGTCVTEEGWLPEGASTDKRKRSTEDPEGCKARVQAFYASTTNFTLVVKPFGPAAVTREMRFGDCIEFNEGCIPGQSGKQPVCTYDTETCNRIGV